MSIIRALTETRNKEAKEQRKKFQKQGKDYCSRRGKVLVPRKDEISNCITATNGKEHYIMEEHTIAYSKSHRTNKETGEKWIDASNITNEDVIPDEEWKDLPSIPDTYMVSNYGRIKSKNRTLVDSRGRTKNIKGKMLSLNKLSGNGYRIVMLCGKNGFRRSTNISRLVAETFIPNPNNLPIVNHIDGNILNNHECNLEWETVKYNTEHAIEHGMIKTGRSSPFAKQFTDEQLKDIFESQFKSESMNISNKRRKELEISQTALAKKYGVSQGVIHRVYSELKENMKAKQHTIAYSKSHRESGIIQARGRIDSDANTLSCGDGGANQSTGNYVFTKPEIRIRKLTPIECCRLQGYPDNHLDKGINDKGEVVDISDTQKYKMVGNGISSPVPAYLFPKIFGTEHIRVMSLFSGCGGTELLLPDNFEIVGHSEIDKYANMVLRYNYPDKINYGDVTELINRKDIPEFDLLTFGYPCQDVSISGKNLGDQGERTSLVWHVCDLIEKHKPKYICAENVKNHLSKKHEKFFTKVLERLSGLGYELDFEVVNSKYFGLAQNRERVFIFGKLK